MTKALKGALLSGVVFPGLGQIAFKRYRRGLILILTVLAGMAVFVVKAAKQAITILENIESGGGDIDAVAISRAAAQVTELSSGLIFNLPLLVIVISWIYATMDAYRIGKQEDLSKTSE